MSVEELEEVKSRLEAARLQIMLGWCIRRMVDTAGNVCALGAVYYGKGEARLAWLPAAATNERLYHRACCALHNALPTEDKTFGALPADAVDWTSNFAMEQDIAIYNNKQTSSGPVIDLFDRAIMDVKQQIADAA